VLQIIEEAVLHAAGQWWVLLAVYLLCTIDGFFPVVPSESVLVALASISGTGDTVSLWWVWLVGALGAITGDQIAYTLGRTIGVERFRWMRTRSVQRAVGSARRALDGHGALVICTARYIPGGRVAVNYTAGATGYPRLRFTLLDIFAAFLWSAYSIGIARATAGWLDSTLLQIVVAVLAAAAIGWVVDVVLKRVVARLAERPEREQAAKSLP
jgi:membrane-associated protein